MVLSVLLVAQFLWLVPDARARRHDRDRDRDRDAKNLGAAVAPLRLVPTGSRAISVRGLHTFLGRIELGAAGDGLVVVNELPLERYLLGLNEVPLEWPMEALRAQAVAARTYALDTLGRAPAGAAATYGFDICASIQCQVFSGADVIALDHGARWIEAVESTKQQAMLYDGAPILARYHSTSGGVTLNNSQAFPLERDYPYLRSVPSTTEEASPLFRWRVVFAMKDLQRILRDAGWWGPRLGELRSVRSIPSRRGFHYPDVLFKGGKGLIVRTAEELREVVRHTAPRLFPARYPSPAATASGRLPESFPSNRLEIATRGRSVVVDGRGWGHGVGMSQWGAHGLARQGASYTRILSHYYSGVTIEQLADPGRIEVGVDWAREAITATGSFRIVDGRGEVLVDDALGEWGFRWAGAGTVAIEPPRGFGLPLRVGIVDAPREVAVGESAFITIALSRPAEVRAVIVAPPGLQDPGTKVKSAGRQRIAWFAPTEPGRYEVRVRASTAAARRASDPVAILVREPPAPQAAGTEDRRVNGEPVSSSPPAWVVVGALALVVSLAIALFAGTIKR